MFFCIFSHSLPFASVTVYLLRNEAVKAKNGIFYKQFDNSVVCDMVITFAVPMKNIYRIYM